MHCSATPRRQALLLSKCKIDFFGAPSLGHWIITAWYSIITFTVIQCYCDIGLPHFERGKKVPSDHHLQNVPPTKFDKEPKRDPFHKLDLKFLRRHTRFHTPETGFEKLTTYLGIHQNFLTDLEFGTF